MTDPTKQPLPPTSPMAAALDAPLGGPAQAPPQATTPVDAAREVAADYRRRRLRHFVAAGIGGTTDAPVIYVYWSHKADADREGSVTTHAGYPVEHRVSGQPRAASDEQQPRAAGYGWTCKADRSGIGGNTPQDCDWPCCGCDPGADKVIAALDERGLLLQQPPPPATGTPAERHPIYDACNRVHDSLKGNPGWQIPDYREGVYDALTGVACDMRDSRLPAPVAADGAGQSDRQWGILRNGSLYGETFISRTFAEEVAATLDGARVVPVCVTVLADDAGAALAAPAGAKAGPA